MHHVPPQEQRQFINKIVRTAKNVTIIFKDISPRPFYKALANYAHDLLIARQFINRYSEGLKIINFEGDGIIPINFSWQLYIYPEKIP